MVTTTVEHFSGGGTLPATLANFLVVLTELAAKPQLTVEDAEDFFDTKPAADAVLGRNGALRYLSLPSTPDARPPIADLYAALY